MASLRLEDMFGERIAAEVTSDDVEQITLGTASGELDEIALAQWLRERIFPLGDLSSPG